MKNHSPLALIPSTVAAHRRELRIPRPPAMLAALIGQIRHDCTNAAKLLDEEHNVVRANYLRQFIAWFGVPAEHANPQIFTSFDRVLWIGAFCVVLFECLCASVLAAITLAAPTAIAVMVGTALTAVFTLTTKAVWHLYIAHDEIQPRRALATLYRWLMPLFAAWALMLTAVMLVPRLVDEPTRVANIIFNIVMSVLAVLSPALSGLLFTAANLYGWARARTQEYHNLQTLGRGVCALSGECDRIASAREAEPAQDGGHSDSSEALRRIGTAAMFVLTIWVIASPLRAEAHGQFWLDDSRSPQVQTLAAAENQFFQVLPGIVGASGVRLWEFYRFSRDAANARPVAILAARPYQPVDCASPAENDEITRLFKKPQVAAKRTRDTQCADRQTTARHDYDKLVLDQVQRTRANFDKVPPARGECTALFDLMNRLRDERQESAPAVAVIVSDGVESCIGNPKSRIPAPSFAMRVFMVVVPSISSGRKMTPWQAFEAQRTSWRQIAPWLEVISIPSLSVATLTRAR